jgi:DNA-binding response OmpR family regulator
MSAVPSSSLPPAILVVDDDRRVVELLSIALTAYGFRVLQAGDGDEALRVALRERPDLVVLDVRLPRKSGFEVCELLRQDPEDPHVPIIMVSAAAETESRLQGLSRGADDYVSKPFSPKELIARIKRLLARSAESREARRRGLAAEHELAHAREDARRSHTELKGQQRLRDLTHVFVRDFHGLLDLDGLAVRLLASVQFHLGTSSAGLFEGGPGEAMRVVATRGEISGRWEALRLARDGELAGLLRGLGRPVRRCELERFPELAADLGPLGAAGFTVLAPVCGSGELRAVLALGERLDGRDFEREDLEVLAVMCETASVALHNARRCRLHAEGLLEMLGSMAERASRPEDAEFRREAAAWVSAAAATVIPRRERILLERAVPLSGWACTTEGRHALLVGAERDPSGWCSEILRLIDRPEPGAMSWPENGAEERRAAALLEAAVQYAALRAGGLPPAEAATRAIEGAAPLLDETAHLALTRALPQRQDAADGASV